MYLHKVRMRTKSQKDLRKNTRSYRIINNENHQQKTYPL